MLASITSRPGQVVRRRTVVAAAWPDGAHVWENTVDSFIWRVRVKLEAIAAPVLMETVRGSRLPSRRAGTGERLQGG